MAGRQVTGPEHYREAESWLETAAEWWKSEGDEANANARAAAAIARAHATLAQAAAMALQIRGADAEAWEAVAGPRREAMPTALEILDGRRG